MGLRRQFELGASLSGGEDTGTGSVTGGAHEAAELRGRTGSPLVRCGGWG